MPNTVLEYNYFVYITLACVELSFIYGRYRLEHILVRVFQ